MKLDRSEFFYPTPPIIITSIVGTVLIAMFHKVSAHAPRRPLKLHTSRVNASSHDIRWATNMNYACIRRSTRSRSSFRSPTASSSRAT